METTKLEKIKHYPCHLQLHTNKGLFEINHDGCDGEFTRHEWRNDEPLSRFNRNDQDEIIKALQMCSNKEFFAPDGSGTDYLFGIKEKLIY